MRINTRFPVAVHILVLLALAGDKGRTSELMARSVNTNPVVIRRTIAMLKKAGLVEVRPGAAGTVLNRDADAVTLLDIYNAVKSSEDEPLFDVHPHPNPQCYVGSNIHEALWEPLSQAQKAMEEKLAEYTLAGVAQPIAKKRPPRRA